MQATVSLTIILFLATCVDVFARHIVTSSDETEPSRLLILVINSDARMSNALRIGEPRLTPEMKDYYIKKHEEKQKELLQRQQARKRAELLEFMKTKYLSTNYFYDEMKRIIRQNTVKDGLRRMVDYLEKPENAPVKRKVMECFFNYHRQQTRIPKFNYKNNNLVINLVKDPFNDGLN